jgi:hypothetical protein
MYRGPRSLIANQERALHNAREVAADISIGRSTMPHRFARVIGLLLGTPLIACSAPAPRPISEPITVRVTSTDAARPVRFTLDVTGGEARLVAPQMRGWATDARLIASTPADVVLGPGTTAADVRALGNGRLDVPAVAGQTRLWADGARVRIASTAIGLSIRDH